MTAKSPFKKPALPSTRQRRAAAKEQAEKSLEFMGPIDLDGHRLNDYATKAARRMQRAGEDREQFCITAAELVVAECVRFESDSPQAQEFFQKPAPGTVASWSYSARLFSVADALFLLRKCEGFDVLCEKARNSDLKSTFAELYAARVFFSRDYAVRFRLPFGIKRYDFDFTATRNFRSISVEVTALDGARYTESRVMRALKLKRDQVSEGVPSVVFVLIPPEWFSQDGLDAELRRQADRFFYGFGEYPGTDIVNLVVFMNEHYQDFGGRGRLTAHVNLCTNLTARHPADDLLPLFEPGNASEEEEREFLASTEAEKSEFFRWAVKIWNEAK